MSLVYLAGPIAGLTYNEALDWRRDVEKALLFDDYYIEVLSPMRGHEWIRAAGKRISGLQIKGYPIATDEAITARDKFDVKRSDVILVNLLGTDDVSIGTCIELGWASAFDKPVILVIEPESNLHDHPMVRAIAAVRVSTLSEGIRAVKHFICPSGMCNAYND